MYRLYMPCGGEAYLVGGEAGIIVSDKKGNVVWFRGPPYSEWQDHPNTTDSPFYQLHSTLEGWHTTVLHIGEVLVVHDQHPDFEAVRQLFIGAANECRW